MSADPTDIEIRRAPRLTAEDVFAAADALLIEGHRPTIDRVRMKLGRGSPNTINAHLDRWWSALGARLRDLPGQVLPGLPETVTNSLLHLWNLAVRESHQALLSSMENREAALATATAELEQRAAALAEQERMVAASRAAVEAALEATRAQLQDVLRRNERLEETLTERDRERARLHSKLEAADGQLTELRQRLDVHREAHAADQRKLGARFDAEQARWLTELDRTRHALRGAEKTAHDVNAQLARAIEKRDTWRAELNQARAEAKALGRANAQLESRIKSLSAVRADAELRAGEQVPRLPRKARQRRPSKSRSSK